MTHQDASANVQAADELMADQTILRRLIKGLCGRLFVVDAHTGAMSELDAEERPFGGEIRSLEELILNVHTDMRTETERLVSLWKSGAGDETVEFQLADTSCCWIWVEAKWFPLTGSRAQEGRHYALALTGIAERKVMEEQLERMAFRDPLTDLPNRRAFDVRFHQAITYAKRYNEQMALLYLDIDDFKLINDTAGHEAGDEFMKAFTRRVTQCLREVDMLARMGGDEFVVLLSRVDSAHSIRIVTERIMNAVRAGWVIGGGKVHASVSMGVASFPEDGHDAQTLMRHADEALYRVKSGGRNGYCFYRE